MWSDHDMLMGATGISLDKNIFSFTATSGKPLFRLRLCFLYGLSVGRYEFMVFV
jgi:hypothetical protein